MAEAVVTFLLEKLSELITREANLVLGVEEEITSLRNELEWIRSFLKDADGKRKTSERASVWVNQVRDVAYDAEDVIDQFLVKVEHQRQRRRSVGGVVVWSLIGCVGSTGQLKTLHHVANQIEKIKRRVEEISANKSKYGIEALQFGGQDETSSSTKSQAGDSVWIKQKMVVAEESEVVGIEEDANMLVNQLVGAGENRFSVVSIVGMGGLGKTTLAKKVYNSSNVIKHFARRAWISLSQEYRLRNVIEGIIEQVVINIKEEDKEKLGKLGDDELGRELFGYLKRRRYLVVIDDIWSIEAWDNLETVFPVEGMNGSKVMLTTRNKEVALYADVESIPHELQFLSDEECWELFCKKVFSKRSMSSISPELEKVGREIVAKCGGLPLAVIVLGGILSRKGKIPDEWAKVLKNINRESSENQSQIFRILSLSYNDLPYYLKPCFLYFAVFPEDFEIPTRKLIWLWVAEGLVRHRGEDELMEEIAEQYLKELIDRSMIQVSTRRCNGKIKTCRIHDLLRDLSISEAREDKFLDVQWSLNSASPTRARRVTLHGSISSYIHLNTPTPHLRSLLCFTQRRDFEVLRKRDWRFIYAGFQLLRVLDLPQMLIHRLPNEIGEMIHLRYLGLGEGFIWRLTSTLRNLSHLQTLNIKPSIITTQRLPSVINEMHQLRHLVMNWGKLNDRSRVDGLRNLQTLSNMEAGRWIENGLAKLTSLRRLGIRFILSSHREAVSDSIIKLNSLQSLMLEARDHNMLPTLMLANHVQLYKLQLFGKIEKLPDLHELPPNLIRLYLYKSQLTTDPMATLEKLPLLRTLNLSEAYIGKGMICSAGGFPQLEELELKDLDDLREWKLEEGAMLNLRRLSINSCYELKMLPEGLQHVTTLQKLELRFMSTEFVSRIRPLKDGPDWYKFQHVSFLAID